MSMIFDEYGRPFIILREQQAQARIRGKEAQKVRTFKIPARQISGRLVVLCFVPCLLVRPPRQLSAGRQSLQQLVCTTVHAQSLRSAGRVTVCLITKERKETQNQNIALFPSRPPGQGSKITTRAPWACVFVCVGEGPV